MTNSNGKTRSRPLTVTFVVPTFNESEFIGGCLTSLFGQALPSNMSTIEVVVVDNESTDTTRDIARGLGATVVVVPASTIAASRNRGAAAGSGAWLAFVDADCELDREWLQWATLHFETPDVVAVGAAIAPPGAAATWVERGWFEIGERHSSEPFQEVGWLATSNMIVKRSAFEEVGGFAEELVTCEDSDLGYRLARRGRLIHESRIQTIHHRDSKTLTELFRREAWRARGNFLGIEHHGLLLSEMPSLLIPIVFIVGLLLSVGVLSAGAILFDSRPWLVILGLTSGLLLMGLPLIMVSRSGALRRNPRGLLNYYVIASTYLLARGVGPFFDFRRLSS